MRKYGVRAVIGKGGMGAKTLAALQESGAALREAAQFQQEVLAKEQLEQLANARVEEILKSRGQS